MPLVAKEARLKVKAKVRLEALGRKEVSLEVKVRLGRKEVSFTHCIKLTSAERLQLKVLAFMA